MNEINKDKKRNLTPWLFSVFILTFIYITMAMAIRLYSMKRCSGNDLNVLNVENVSDALYVILLFIIFFIFAIIPNLILYSISKSANKKWFWVYAVIVFGICIIPTYAIIAYAFNIIC